MRPFRDPYAVVPAQCVECGEELCGSEPVWQVGNSFMCKSCLIEFLGCNEEDFDDEVERAADIFERTAYEAAIA